MLDYMFTAIIDWIENVISFLRYFGVIFFMALESCNVPLPSEIILSFVGFTVSEGGMNYHLASWCAALGCLIGSVPSYYLGYWGGRVFFEKYGKFLLVSKKDLEDADKWVEKYGNWAFFLCRMLPIIRTFISLPAGILRAKKRIFFTLTFLGSLIWCYILVYIGTKIGDHIEKLAVWWHKFDILIISICFILASIYIYKHIKNLKNS